MQSQSLLRHARTTSQRAAEPPQQRARAVARAQAAAAARKNMADAMDVDASQPRQFRLVKASGDAPHAARLPPSLGARLFDDARAQLTEDRERRERGRAGPRREAELSAETTAVPREKTQTT